MEKSVAFEYTPNEISKEFEKQYIAYNTVKQIFMKNLLNEIKNKGHTVIELCESLSMNRTGFYRKLSNQSFTGDELHAIAKHLEKLGI